MDSFNMAQFKGQARITTATGEHVPSAVAIGIGNRSDFVVHQNDLEPSKHYKFRESDDYDGIVVNRSKHAGKRIDSSGCIKNYDNCDATIIWHDKDEALVIDKKDIKKKKVYHVYAEESPSPIEQIGVQPKQALKRSNTDELEEENFTHTIVQTNPVNKGVKKFQVHELMDKINRKEQVGPTQIVLDSELFSGFENLTVCDNHSNSGSFGEVTKVYDLKSQHNLMKKKIKEKLEPNEIEIPMEFPQSKHLARIAGIWFDGVHTQIIQEDAGFSLRRLIADQNFLKSLEKPEKLEKIMMDIYSGLSLLACHGITHCDIKPENICIKFNQDDSCTAKLIDFGSSKTQKDRMTFRGLTPEYLPPSINSFLHNVYLFQKKQLRAIPSPYPRLCGKDDVWAAGMVAVFLIKGVHPTIKFFTGLPDYPSQGNVEDLRYKTMENIGKMTDPLPEYFFAATQSVISELLHHVLVVDQNMRWTAERAISFLREKLRSEPHSKKFKSDLLIEPVVVKRENSCEDVDIKKCKGISKPHLPVNRNPSEDNAVGLTFGTAFKLKTVAVESVAALKCQPTEKSPVMPFSKSKCWASPENQQLTEDMEYDQLVKSFSEKLPMHKEGKLPMHKEESFDPNAKQIVEEHNVFFGVHKKVTDISFVHKEQSSFILGTSPFLPKFAPIVSREVYKFTGKSSQFLNTTIPEPHFDQATGNIPNMGALFDDLIKK
ncbi:uncharacterized protein LOC131949966 [Physella acuta]|uniref:uncharacterized protein LOC131949966 n=1 Tax=Physella acuta TaxID=109671 RepID=UPI0027DCFE2F|nr:uncharacterized protein LOC131949966 [Physella acuta]